jgi:hypothetical protein
VRPFDCAQGRLTYELVPFAILRGHRENSLTRQGADAGAAVPFGFAQGRLSTAHADSKSESACFAQYDSAVGGIVEIRP